MSKLYSLGDQPLRYKGVYRAIKRKEEWALKLNTNPAAFLLGRIYGPYIKTMDFNFKSLLWEDFKIGNWNLHGTLLPIGKRKKGWHRNARKTKKNS